MWLYSFPSAIYWRDRLFSIGTFLASLSWINWQHMHGIISVLSTLFHWFMCLEPAWLKPLCWIFQFGYYILQLYDFCLVLFIFCLLKVFTLFMHCSSLTLVSILMTLISNYLSDKSLIFCFSKVFSRVLSCFSIQNIFLCFFIFFDSMCWFLHIR